MNARYNEIEPFAASWLEALVSRDVIARGVVDRRSIVDLKPADVAGPGQRHFFAGIGVWSYALRLAGIPDDADVWTGSCPCQPFSGAGKGLGVDDPRHLWPAWFRLIAECRPPVIFGEQVASPAGLAWLDAVYADLEGAGYSVGAADLCAAGVGAPHIRQRLFFVAYADELSRRQGSALARGRNARVGATRRSHERFSRGGSALELAHDNDERREGAQRTELQIEVPQARRRGGMGDASSDRARQHTRELSSDESEHEIRRAHGDHAPVAAGATRGFWANAEWVPCIDGVSRPIEPGTFPLAHGAPARVGRLRGYGNAIVAEAAAEFIEAAIEAAGGE